MAAALNARQLAIFLLMGFLGGIRIGWVWEELETKAHIPHRIKNRANRRRCYFDTDGASAALMTFLFCPDLVAGYLF
jgi:hypothetical protein